MARFLRECGIIPNHVADCNQVRAGIVCKLKTDDQRKFTKIIFELWIMDDETATCHAPLGRSRKVETLV
jgi:hypothetical protein